MRVALCFFGLPRCLELSYIFHKHYIIDPLGCDTFIHTWDIDNGGCRFASEANHAISSNRFADESFRSKTNLTPCFSKTVKEYIIEDIKPKSFLIQNYSSFSEKYGTASTPALYNSVNEVNLLRRDHEIKNNFNYDLVILSRMDVMFAGGIPTVEIQNILNNPNILYVTLNRSPEVEAKHMDGIISDGFIFGSSTAINHYSEGFNFWKQNNHLRNELVYYNNFKDTKFEIKQSNTIIYLIEQYTENEWYSIYHTKA